MGLVTSEKKTYLHIGFGKLRQKALPNALNAVARQNKDDVTVWEYVYSWVEGRIIGIYHKEDDKFGNSFEVTFDDGKEKYQVSFPEGTNFFQDFFSKLPNVDLSRIVKVIPYDFEDKANGRRRKGITVMQGGNKIENCFVVKEGDVFNYKFGFPKPENPKKMDKDDWKIYFLTVTKFLRKYIKDTIIPQLRDGQTTEALPDVPEATIPIDDPDMGDLPF